MQRIAAIFTCLVFSVLIGGLLSRREGSPEANSQRFQPESTPILPPLMDPLGAARTSGSSREDRAQILVVDPAGLPVAGAALVVRCGGSTIWAFTQADGTAMLDGLLPGKSRLAVLAFPRPGLEIEIEPGAEVRRIVLPATAAVPMRLPDIARSRFAGQLGSSGSAEHAGYELLLLPFAPASELGGTLPRSAVCDHEGRFSLEGLAHGRYLLRVLPPWASGGSWPDLSAPRDRELDFQGDRTEQVIELSRGSIEGEVKDDLGRALEGALILANEVANEGHAWPPTSSGPDGRFLFVDLPPGKYRITCRAGEGGTSIDELVVEAGAVAWAALPPFAARKR